MVRMRWTGWFLGSFSVGLAGSAHAQVLQPDGMQIPVDEALSSDYFDTTRYNAATLGLQHLLDAWEGSGTVDMKADARTEPSTFAPLCTTQGSVILRGGSCLVNVGWYCADDPPGSEVIHPLVTQADMVNYHDVVMRSFTGSPLGDGRSWYDAYNNSEKGFVPTLQMGRMQPVVGASSQVELHNDPYFLACPSGRIGFAFRGNPTSYCPQSKFLEQSRNEMSTYAEPWISAVVYESRSPGKYYVAFEELPTRPETFSPMLTALRQYYPTMAQPNGWDGRNDGDMNDLVLAVEGVICEGGRRHCETGLPGICGAGFTECAPEGEVPACLRARAPEPEDCDGIDNDCDAQIDESDSCASQGAGWVCNQGRCMPNCVTADYLCEPGFTCVPSTGKCTDLDCEGMVCASGLSCRAGTCLDGCAAVTCPSGSDCLQGRCVDLCRDVTCTEGFVCHRGSCVVDCACSPCPAGQVCQSSGLCADALCANVVCGAGERCIAGQCVDPCQDVVCGSGQVCQYGSCVVGGAGGAGGANLGGQGGSAAQPPTGGTATATGASGGAGDPTQLTGGAGGGASNAGVSGSGDGGGIPDHGVADGGVGQGGTRNPGPAGGVPGVCVPGRQLECPCPTGLTGSQQCASDGKSFGECECAPAPAANGGSVDGGSGDSGCGCSVPGESRRTGALALGLALMLALGRRRSRCTRR